LADARRGVPLAGAVIDVHGTQRDAPPARAKRTEKWAARRLADALLGGRQHQLARKMIEFDLPPVVDESHALLVARAARRDVGDDVVPPAAQQLHQPLQIAEV